MASKIEQIKGLHRVENGFEWSAVLDLSADDFHNRYFIDVGAYRHMAVSMIGINASGTTGDLSIEQASAKTGKSFAFTVAKTLTIDIDGEVSDFAVDTNARYLVLDLTGMSLGSTGKIKLLVNGKR